eukprot:TRINITY_DN101066_c0_g1_i1.p1 TRINITY_DN101066_c0_g1~~TRINITY_DN101066_c0_g1_i1.p1  ORF type:complete len:247 (+),score=64.07 TRINITY_DN101066_c0_g1_i1:89-829(+)
MGARRASQRSNLFATAIVSALLLAVLGSNLGATWTLGPSSQPRSSSKHQGIPAHDFSDFKSGGDATGHADFQAAGSFYPFYSWAAAACAALVVATGTLLGATPAAATEKRDVAAIPASGFLFKDTINVEAFEDPKVSGVTLYISDFSRSMADRVSKGDFFSDPGAAGLSCVRTGPVKVSPDLKPNKEGEDVFTEARSLMFKTLKVKRVYDAEAKNVVYVVFTEKMDANDDKNKSRFKSQVCAVHAE